MNLTFRTNKEITACQVADCIATLSSIMSWMDNGEESQPMEENVKTSLEGTAIRVLNRLDKIIDDDKHWALPDTDAHYYGVRSLELEHAGTEAQLKYQEFLRQKAIVSMVETGEVVDVEATPIKPRRNRKGSRKS